MIAVALACKPEILIADEPTTALDVTIQAQIMELIGSLQKELDMAVILVTHDLGVVASVADYIQVMYAGKIVERGTVDEIFYHFTHPYTRALLNPVPKIHTNNKETLYSLKGTPPDLINPPKGCSFAPRCEYGMKICRMQYPEETKFSHSQKCSCWLHHPKADVSGLPENMVRRGNTVMNEKEVLIEVKDLRKYFQVGRHQVLKAVDGVSFKIYKGETLGLVGESGCGKTTCGKTVMGLYDANRGRSDF